MSAPRRDMATSFHRANWRDGRRESKVLARVPRAALVARLELQIAAGHVETNGVAKDGVERRSLRYPCRFLADRDDQLGFVMIVACLRRIRNLAAAGCGRIRKLGEKERCLAIRILTHLACVRRVVAANAKDATDRKSRLGPRDRHRGPFG